MLMRSLLVILILQWTIYISLVFAAQKTHNITADTADLRCTDQITKLASAMRNGMGIASEPDKAGSGSSGIIFCITFDDGIKWAAKITHRRQSHHVNCSINALKALHKYCPHIPVVETHGGIMVVESNHDYIFHFMDWVEGAHPAMVARTYAQGLTAESLPRKLVPQLADFVYNFTTCPLPASESQNSRLYILTAIAKLISQTDPSDNNKYKLPTFAA